MVSLRLVALLFQRGGDASELRFQLDHFQHLLPGRVFLTAQKHADLSHVLVVSRQYLKRTRAVVIAEGLNCMVSYGCRQSTSLKRSTPLCVAFVFLSSTVHFSNVFFLFSSTRQGSHNFQKTFIILFYLGTLTPSVIFICPKFWSWNTMQKTSAKLSSTVKNKIWIKNVRLWNFRAFSISYVYFGQIQYFFKALKNDFTIQYFFNKYFQYRVGTLSGVFLILLQQSGMTQYGHNPVMIHY